MSLQMEDLDKRLMALEREVEILRRRLDFENEEETAIARGSRLVAEAKRGKPRWQAGWRRAFGQMGVEGVRPVSPEVLRNLMAQDGILPEERLFSRGIAEMREE